MSFKHTLSLVASLVAGAVFADVATWYVDAANYSKADNDGGKAKIWRH